MTLEASGLAGLGGGCGCGEVLMGKDRMGLGMCMG
jgi:hypothetical protein